MSAGIFGWSYPPGCSGPPDEYFDDRTEDEAADQELLDECDPCEAAEFTIGDGMDTIYLDYAVDTERKRIAIRSTLDCETGHFIQNFEAPGVYGYAEAVQEAQRLVSMALDWLVENEVRHVIGKHGTDPAYFYRYVKWEAGGRKGRRPGRRQRQWYRRFVEDLK